MAKTLDEAGVKRLIQEIKGANKNLNTAIPISMENTPESKAQNVKNIADYVEKAKAAGITDVNGMAVTCIINGGISGLGYIYVTGNSFDLIGMTMWDDMVDNAFFMVSEGEFNSRKIAFEGTVDTVTSDMLATGARKPIILTLDTTEVDEETYQKLLSDDVDVVFKTAEGNLCTLTFKVVDSTTLSLVFTNLSLESGATIDDLYLWLYGFEVVITKDSPHNCTIYESSTDTLNDFLGLSNLIDKSTLSPVLQEIDLTGTDADRKAKLDQFEADWKALTGASNLKGARFVGKLDINQMLVGCIFAYSSRGYFDGISLFNEENYQNFKVSIYTETGALTITPLFSHLEAITIKTGNTPEDKAANVAAINAYVDNLTALGVDVTKGYMIPFHKYNTNAYGVLIGNGTTPRLQGYLNGDNTAYAYVVTIDGTVAEALIQLRAAAGLTTTSKYLVDAINEVNALAKGYSTIFTPIELTTETAQNKTAIDARVAAFTAQGISLTNGCCIPVTYKGVYAGNISLINGDWYGLLVKNTNNPADNINIKLSADGTITEGNSAQ